MYAADTTRVQDVIAWVARSLRRQFRGYIDVETIESAANFGVFRAWRGFDESRLGRGDFYTFLEIRGRQRAIDALREEGDVIRGSLRSANRRRRPPRSALSLERLIYPDQEHDGLLRDLIGAKSRDLAAVDDQDATAWLISCLPKRLQHVIVLYFYEGLTLERIGRLIARHRATKAKRGVSAPQVSHLLEEAYRRLRRQAPRAGVALPRSGPET